MSSSTNNLIISLIKFALISIGAVSLGLLLKGSVIPLVYYYFPPIWTGVIAWLKPPYLYFVINGIIIIIVATSRSSNKLERGSSDQFQPLISVRTPPSIAISHADIQSELKVFEATRVVHEPEVFEVIKPVVVNGSVVAVERVDDEGAYNEPHDNDDDGDVVYKDAIVISNSVTHPLPEAETGNENELLLLPPPVMEKPLASSRFAHRKPPVKTSPEALRRKYEADIKENGHLIPGMKVLGVARSRKPETLENTWRMITEGRHVPLTRHLKKLDTWQNHVTIDEENVNATPPPRPHAFKAETFKDRTNYESPVAVKIRKEPSDDLNRRVEAFIKKFNEDMRLQRQQSIQQYMEMINRGL